MRSLPRVLNRDREMSRRLICHLQESLDKISSRQHDGLQKAVSSNGGIRPIGRSA